MDGWINEWMDGWMEGWMVWMMSLLYSDLFSITPLVIQCKCINIKLIIQTSIYLSTYVHVCIHVSIYLFIYLSIYLFIYVFTSQPSPSTKPKPSSDLLFDEVNEDQDDVFSTKLPKPTTKKQQVWNSIKKYLSVCLSVSVCLSLSI